MITALTSSPKDCVCVRDKEKEEGWREREREGGEREGGERKGGEREREGGERKGGEREGGEREGGESGIITFITVSARCSALW